MTSTEILPRAFYTLCRLDPEERRFSPEELDRSAEAALRFGVDAVFFDNVKKKGLSLSPEIHEKLKASSLRTSRQSLRWAVLFREIARAFQAAGVPFVPLKGLSLMTDTYPDEGLRRTADLDLFIPRERLGDAVAVAERLGYRSENEEVRGVLANHGQEWVMRNPERIELDLHTRFFPWYEETHVYGFHGAEMAASAEKKVWRGMPMLYLRKEDEILYLLFCFLRSQCADYKYLVDADAIARRHPKAVDWVRLGKRAERSSQKKRLTPLLRWVAGRREDAPPGFPPTAHRPESAYLMRSTAKPIDKVALASVYLKWRLFKACGFFKGYFIQKNGSASGNFS